MRKLRFANCNACGIKYSHRQRDGSTKYCSKKCWSKCVTRWNKGKHGLQSYAVHSTKASLQLKKEYELGIRNRAEIVKNAHKRNRELAKLGKLMIQQLETKIKLAQLRFEKRRLNPNSASKWEKIFRSHLLEHNKEFFEEFPFREFSLDFAFPNEKIAIEINIGWHNSDSKRSKDNRKKALLQKEGWKLYFNKCSLCDWELKFKL